MRVTILHPSVDLYGIDKILLNIVQNESFSQITVVLTGDGRLSERLRREHPNVSLVIFPSLPVAARVNLNFRGILKLLFNVARFISWSVKSQVIKNSELIYLNGTPLFITGLILDKRNKPIITHVHETFTHKSIIEQIMVKAICSFSLKVFCVSDSVRKSMMRIMPRYSHFHLLYNGTARKPSSILPYKYNNFVTVSLIGRIKPSRKGQMLLLQSIVMLNESIKSRLFVRIVGGVVPGDEFILDELNSFIEKNKLKEIVIIEDFKDNEQELYGITDVVIVPSTFEDPLPTTVLEGMSFGRPVVGTNLGGIPEMIVNDLTGYIFSVDNPQELSKILSNLVQNMFIIEDLGAKGKIRHHDFFSLEVFQENLSNLLRVEPLSNMDQVNKGH